VRAPRPSLTATELPRLLSSTSGADLDAHQDRFGPLPSSARGLAAEVERAGLRGKGGAGFPTAVKLRAVAAGRRGRVVVANGTEGEPASAKDRALLRHAPHLVLDGATLAAEAVGAQEVILCVARDHATTRSVLDAALAERRGAGLDRVPVRVAEAPHHYVSGEESALVNWLNGGEAKPTFVPPRPFERGVRGRPTLVDNVETLAHLALVARFGAAWFRGVGTDADPGSTLVTLSGAVRSPGVYEVAAGPSIAAIIEGAGGSIDQVEAVLVGGYFGTWITVDQAASTPFAADPLKAIGAAPGCGVVFALPKGACGLAESARVARWLADENAGQCGPCVHGLDAVAGQLAMIDEGGRSSLNATESLESLLAIVEGRGACRHPDGAVRFVRSALRVFGAHAAQHRRHGACRAAAPLLPTPRTGGWR